MFKQDINVEQSIKSFLGKPVLMDDGLLNTTDAVSTFGQFSVPGSILNLSNLFTDKLKGFFGFKATTVITLQINATRFTQGRYMLNFYPTCGAIDPASAAIMVSMHNFNRTLRTQVPGIQIDVNCETQVQLKIPFVSAYPFYSLRALSINNSVRSIGVIQLHPYVPVTATAQYTIFAHFEDVELIGATMPQSSAEKEQKSKDVGTVETNLRKLTLATSYAKQLPVIGSTLESLGWVSDIAANIASVWGWSKPTSNDAPKPILRHRAYQSMNVDGVDISTKMAFSCKNEIAQLNGLLGSNVDEMCFKYIQSVPAFYTQTNWTNAQLKEVLLTSFELRPTFFVDSDTDNGNTVITFVPCSIPAINFNMYRGSFNITIKIVKTEFHTGRLAVVFQPGASDGNLTFPTMTYANTFYCHRHIIDIRYGNEWTFNFPYISDELYKQVNAPYGKVYVYIENPLVAVSTVPTSVNLLYEISGGADLEYAQPAPTNYYPYLPSAPQSSNGGQFACDKVEEVIGTAIPDSDETITSALAIGEKMTSYRQLLKRFEMRGRVAALAANTYYIVIPYGMGIVNGNGTAGTPSYPQTSPDAFTRIGVMYGLARGSVRVKLLDLKPAGQGSLIAYAANNVSTVSYEYTAITVDNNGQGGPVPMAGNPVAYITLNDGLTGEVQTPMYTNNYAYPICDTIITNNHSYSASGTAPSVALNFTNSSAAGNAPMYMRSIGDDFSFGYFISTVPMINSPSAYRADFT